VLDIGNKSSQRLVMYLLGELSAEERQDIEEQYFQNDKLFQELLSIESDLIDDYLNDDLSVEERRKFESQVLSTAQGRRKVESSRARLNAISEVAPKVVQRRITEEQDSWWQFLWHPVQTRAWRFATVILLFAGGTGWLAVENIRLRSQLGVARTTTQQDEQELQRLKDQVAAAQHQRQQDETVLRSNIEKLKEELQRAQTERENAMEVARQKESQLKENLRQSQPSTALATYIFPFNPVRGTSEQTAPLTINKGQKTVSFQIDLGPTSIPAFHVSLQTVEGSEVWGSIKKARRTRAGSSITIRLPATVFASQHYILELTPSPPNGQTDNFAAYSFQVVKND
jgi:hypothetical protein